MPDVPQSQRPAPSGAAIAIEVCYAEAERSIVKMLRLEVPATLADALRAASADPEFASLDLKRAAAGVFGRVVLPAEPLHDGDRVEIYRPLTVDPKSARRARARESRKT